MGQIGHGLNQLGEPWPGAFVQGHCQNDRQGYADKQFHKAVEEGVPQELSKVEGPEEGGEVVKTYPTASQDTIKGHEILEGYLAIPDGQILEKDEIRNRKNQQGIESPVPLDIANQITVYALGGGLRVH